MLRSILLLVLCCSSVWGGYTNQVKITFNNHPSTTLTNYVSFVCANGPASSNCDSSAHSNLAIPNLKTVGNGGVVTSTSGFDIGVFTTSACSTTLNYFLDYYSPTTGTLNLRVLISSLSSSADAIVYLCFGNSAITTNQSTTSTFPAEYLARWNFSDGTTLSVADSTVNVNIGVITGGVTAGVGELNGGAVFDGTGYITAAGVSSINGIAATWSCWVNPSNTSSGIIFSTPLANSPYLFKQGDGTIAASEAAFANPLITTNTLAASSWTMVTMTVDNAIVVQPHRIYVNGVEASYSALGAQGNGLGIVTSLRIGAYFDASLKWNGSLDECLFLTSLKSAGWVASKFANESAPYNFYLFGADTPVGGPKFRVEVK